MNQKVLLFHLRDSWVIIQNWTVKLKNNTEYLRIMRKTSGPLAVAHITSVAKAPQERQRIFK